MAINEKVNIDSLCVQDPESRRGKEVIGEDYVQPSLFMHILKSLMPGQDLTRVLIPVFFLEPRSLLERFADLMMHIDLIEDPKLTEGTDEDRFLSFLRFYLSGWHYKTKGCKKPYNPIIGETFSCFFDTEKRRYHYLAEQVSHHPPVSAIYFESPDCQMVANGQIWTKSSFTGNSAKSIIDGFIKLQMFNNGDKYYFTFPSFAATGLFIGTLMTQLCEKSTVKCYNTGYEANFEFFVKPMLYGEYNCVEGVVKHNGTAVYKIKGHWDTSFNITDLRTKKTEEFLTITGRPVLGKYCLRDEFQGPYESRNLWKELTKDIRREDPQWKNVEIEKTKIEEAQRKLPCQQDKKSAAYKPWNRKLFHLENDEDIGKEVWKFNDPYTKEKVPNRDLVTVSRESSLLDERVTKEGFVKIEDIVNKVKAGTIKIEGDKVIFEDPPATSS